MTSPASYQFPHCADHDAHYHWCVGCDKAVDQQIIAEQAEVINMLQGGLHSSQRDGEASEH